VSYASVHSLRVVFPICRTFRLGTAGGSAGGAGRTFQGPKSVLNKAKDSSKTDQSSVAHICTFSRTRAHRVGRENDELWARAVLCGREVRGSRGSSLVRVSNWPSCPWEGDTAVGGRGPTGGSRRQRRRRTRVAGGTELCGGGRGGAPLWRAGRCSMDRRARAERPPSAAGEETRHVFARSSAPW